MRVMLIVSYDGSNYCGLQKQKNGVSIQQVLESAIEKATGKVASVTASGRTDAGVHAEGQVFHFDTESSIPDDRFYKAINAFLPNEIKVLASKEVEKDFNARKSAKKKTYAYSFYYSEFELPLLDRYSVRIDSAPNFDKMEQASKLFIGEHDFKAFSATGSSVKSTVRKIYSIDIKKEEKGFKIFITGGGFLYNMVRIISGVLLDVGYGKKSEDDILNAFSTGRRELLGKTLPAKGLTLIEVEY